MGRKEELISLVERYRELGIDRQIDYDKFYLYSIITHSTAIEGSTITEVENQLLFETARYNFSKYMVRNFDMKFRHEQGIGMFILSEFLNFDEAYLYRKRLYSDGGMASMLEGINTIVITAANLELLLSHYSFNDYTEFYNRHFLNIPEVDIKGQTIDEELNADYNSDDYE